jgi:hypothetical protein
MVNRSPSAPTTDIQISVIMELAKNIFFMIATVL